MLASFASMREACVTEITIRKANKSAWGNHLVVGSGSLTCPSVYSPLAQPVLWLACEV
jgi:hypothetical protein